LQYALFLVGSIFLKLNGVSQVPQTGINIKFFLALIVEYVLCLLSEVFFSLSISS